MPITKEYQDKFRNHWRGTKDELISHLEEKIRQLSVIMDGMELDCINLEKERDALRNRNTTLEDIVANKTWLD